SSVVEFTRRETGVRLVSETSNEPIIIWPMTDGYSFGQPSWTVMKSPLTRRTKRSTPIKKLIGPGVPKVGSASSN
ncbi:unnamed protein product, partial [Nesidiocoris tenuis]